MAEPKTDRLPALDSELLAALREGPDGARTQGAWRAFYDPARARAILALKAAGAAQGEREEIVDQVMCNLWRNRAGITTSPIGYLMRSAYNALNTLRRSYREGPTTPRGSEDEPPEKAVTHRKPTYDLDEIGLRTFIAYAREFDPELAVEVGELLNVKGPLGGDCAERKRRSRLAAALRWVPDVEERFGAMDARELARVRLAGQWTRVDRTTVAQILGITRSASDGPPCLDLDSVRLLAGYIAFLARQMGGGTAS